MLAWMGWSRPVTTCSPQPDLQVGLLGSPNWAAAFEAVHEGGLTVQPSEIPEVLNRPISQALLVRDRPDSPGLHPPRTGLPDHPIET
jgi:hypothetical protein